MRTHLRASSRGRSRAASRASFQSAPRANRPRSIHAEHTQRHRARGESRGGPRAGHRRHGLELHLRGDRAHAGRGEASARMRRCSSRPITTSRRRRGSIRHFRKIAEATKLPIILYSIPGRCGIEIGVETVVRLAQRLREHRRDQGSRRLGRARERVARGACRRSSRFSRATIRSRCRSSPRARAASSASRPISIPQQVVDLVRCALAGDFAQARALHSAVLSALQGSLHRAESRAGQSTRSRSPARCCRMCACRSAACPRANQREARSDAPQPAPPRLIYGTASHSHQWRTGRMGQAVIALRRPTTRRLKSAPPIDVGDDFAAALPRCQTRHRFLATTRRSSPCSRAAWNSRRRSSSAPPATPMRRSRRSSTPRSKSRSSTRRTSASA